MDIAGLIVFSAAFVLAAASPGPAVAAIVARVLGRGMVGTPAFIAGLVVGDLVWLAVAVLGLATLAQTFATAFLVVKWAGIAYLLYLAWRIWTAPVAAEEIAPDTRADGPLRLFAGGLALTLGNPKVMAFYLALLPNILDLGTISLVGFLEVATLIVVILSPILFAYALAAARARRLFASVAARRALNRGSAVAMAGAAGWIAAR